MSDIDKKVHKPNSAIVISSRIRLARNIAGKRFVSGSSSEQLSEVYNICADALSKVKRLKDASVYNMGQLSDFEREILMESRAISKELETVCDAKGAFVLPDGKVSVFINEEDHIRIQVIGNGLVLGTLFKTASNLDDEIESHLEYAFSSDLGYITSCPTNIGTGLRASVMLHLPALSINCQIDRIVRGLNQMGMVVRGSNGEGSDWSSAYYQLSNQQTLGVSEEEVLKKIQTFTRKLCQFEKDARYKILEDNPIVLEDKFLRARATLENCKLIDSDEALANLSTLRLAADLNFMGDGKKTIEILDELSMRLLPCHLQQAVGDFSADSQRRDELRAEILNQEISKLPDIKIKGF